MGKIRRVDPENVSRDVILEAKGIVEAGGVVVFPTSGLYGLGVDALDRRAVAGVFRVKQRSSGKPISVLAKDRAALESLVEGIPPTGLMLMDRFWPGKLTVVLYARDILPTALTAGTGKIGVRIPAHPVAAALLNELDRPLTATSANLAGREGHSQIVDLDPGILDGADLVLDAGSLGGMGSTVVDATVVPPVIIREGAVPAADILDAIDNPH